MGHPDAVPRPGRGAIETSTGSAATGWSPATPTTTGTSTGTSASSAASAWSSSGTPRNTAPTPPSPTGGRQLGRGVLVPAGAHPHLVPHRGVRGASAVSQQYAERVLDRARARAPGAGPDAAAMRLPDTVLPPDLNAYETREAYRALKGHALRDRDLRRGRLARRRQSRTRSPSRISPSAACSTSAPTSTRCSSSIRARRVLPVRARARRPARHARADPAGRRYGNVLRSVSVGYPRRAGYPPPEPALSAGDAAMLAYDQGAPAHAGDRAATTPTRSTTRPWPDAYRAPLPSASRRGRDHRRRPGGKGTGITNLFGFDEIDSWRRLADRLGPGPRHALRGDPGLRRGRRRHPGRAPDPADRRAGSGRCYRSDDLTALLPPGQLEPLALPGETYQAALTPGLLPAIFGAAGPRRDPDRGRLRAAARRDWLVDAIRPGLLLPRGRRHAGRRSWRARAAISSCRGGPSTRSALSPGPTTTATICCRQPRPIRSATSPPRVNDYRVLQPAQVTDPNGNRAAAAFDVLGLVAGTAVMGKTTREARRLADRVRRRSGRRDDARPVRRSAGRSGCRSSATRPRGSSTTSTPTSGPHAAAQPSPPARLHAGPRDPCLGSGHAHRRRRPATSTTSPTPTASAAMIQRKAQAAPGPLTEGGPPVSPRWAGSGWTIFNNKGRPVRTYEPFFSATNAFEFAARPASAASCSTTRRAGRSPRCTPTTAGRRPSSTPGGRSAWDGNDTVLIADPRADADVGDYFLRLLGTGAVHVLVRAADRRHVRRDARGSGRAAGRRAEGRRARGHPAVAHFDALGRTCLAVADNGGGEPVPGPRRARHPGQAAGGLRRAGPAGGGALSPRSRSPVAASTYLAGADMAGNPLYQNAWTAAPGAT